MLASCPLLATRYAGILACVAGAMAESRIWQSSCNSSAGALWFRKHSDLRTCPASFDPAMHGFHLHIGSVVTGEHAF